MWDAMETHESSSLFRVQQMCFQGKLYFIYFSSLKCFFRWTIIVPGSIIVLDNVITNSSCNSWYIHYWAAWCYVYWWPAVSISSACQAKMLKDTRDIKIIHMLFWAVSYLLSKECCLLCLHGNFWMNKLNHWKIIRHI